MQICFYRTVPIPPLESRVADAFGNPEGATIENVPPQESEVANNAIGETVDPVPPSKKSKHVAFVWKDGLAHFLIDRWGEEALFSAKDPHYHAKNKRTLALDRLLTAIDESDHNH